MARHGRLREEPSRADVGQTSLIDMAVREVLDLGGGIQSVHLVVWLESEPGKVLPASICKFSRHIIIHLQIMWPLSKFLHQK